MDEYSKEGQQSYGSYKVLEAETLNIVDPAGNTRSSLQAFAGGVVSFTMNDDNEEPRIHLTVGDSGSPIVTLSDGDGEARMMLTLSSDGDPLAALYRADGTKGLTVMVAPDGPWIGLADSPEEERISISVFKGMPALAISDNNGTHRIVLVVDHHGGRLLFGDEKGDVRREYP